MVSAQSFTENMEGTQTAWIGQVFQLTSSHDRVTRLPLLASLSMCSGRISFSSSWGRETIGVAPWLLTTWIWDSSLWYKLPMLGEKGVRRNNLEPSQQLSNTCFSCFPFLVFTQNPAVFPAPQLYESLQHQIFLLPPALPFLVQFNIKIQTMQMCWKIRLSANKEKMYCLTQHIAK